MRRLRTDFDLILRWPLVTIPDVLKSGSSMTSKVVDQVPGCFVVEFFHEVLYFDGHSFGGPAHVAPFP